MTFASVVRLLASRLSHTAHVVRTSLRLSSIAAADLALAAFGRRAVVVLAVCLGAARAASGQSIAWVPFNDNSANTVTLRSFDVMTGAKFADVSLGKGSASGITASPDGQRVYLTLTNSGATSSDGSLVVLNTATRSVAAAIPLLHPSAVAVSRDSSRVFVSELRDLTIRRATDFSVMRTIQYGGFRELLASPDGRHLYGVANSALVIIDTVVNDIVDTVLLPMESARIAVTPDATRLVAAGEQRLVIVDLVNRQIERDVAVTAPGYTYEDVAISADGTKAYVTQRRSELLVVNLSTWNLATKVVPGVSQDLALTADGSRLVINSNRWPALVIDTATDSPLPDAFPSEPTPGATALIALSPAMMPPLATPPAPAARNVPLPTTTSLGAVRVEDMTPDGRYVVFMSYEPLTGDDTNGMADIYMKDMTTGGVERVSVGTGGDEATAPGVQPGNTPGFLEAELSDDGRFVAFVGLSRGLVPGETVVRHHVFVRDRQTGVTTAVTARPVPSFVRLDQEFAWLELSGDGRILLFQSSSSDLPGAPPSPYGVVYDRVAANRRFVSHRYVGGLSRDGRFFAAAPPTGNGDASIISTADLSIVDTIQSVSWSSPDHPLLLSDDGRYVAGAVRGCSLFDRVTKKAVTLGGGCVLRGMSSDLRFFALTVTGVGAPGAWRGSVTGTTEPVPFVLDRLTGRYLEREVGSDLAYVEGATRAFFSADGSRLATGARAWGAVRGPFSTDTPVKITAVSPAVVQTSRTLTIRGSGFSPGTRVVLRRVSSTYEFSLDTTVVSSTELRAAVPQYSPCTSSNTDGSRCLAMGNHRVLVRTPNGSSAGWPSVEVRYLPPPRTDLSWTAVPPATSGQYRVLLGGIANDRYIAYDKDPQSSSPREIGLFDTATMRLLPITLPGDYYLAAMDTSGQVLTFLTRPDSRGPLPTCQAEAGSSVEVPQIWKTDLRDGSWTQVPVPLPESFDCPMTQDGIVTRSLAAQLSPNARYLLLTCSEFQGSCNAATFFQRSHVLVDLEGTGVRVLPPTPGDARPLNPGGLGVGALFSPSADGKFVFLETRHALDPRDTNGANDLYRQDTTTGVRTLVSIGPDGSVFATGSGHRSFTWGRAVTPDGRFALFRSAPETTTPAHAYLRDIETGTTEPVSVNDAGQLGTDIADPYYPLQMSLTPDARFVLMVTKMKGLVSEDADPFRDVFLRDRHFRTTKRLATNVGDAGMTTTGSGVLFPSSDRLLAGADGAGLYLWHGSPPPVLQSVDPAVVSPAAPPEITLRGRFFADGSTVHFGGVEGAGVRIIDATTLAVTPPAGLAGFVDVSVSNPDGSTGILTGGLLYAASALAIAASSPTGVDATGSTARFSLPPAPPAARGSLRAQDTLGALPIVRVGGRLASGVEAIGPSTWQFRTPDLPPGIVSLDLVVEWSNQVFLQSNAFRVLGTSTAVSPDTDSDGIADTAELLYGLDPLTADATADPDADGVTNAQEIAAGTHPHGFERRYLAEGATSSFFDTQVALLNPTDTPAWAGFRYLDAAAATRTQMVEVPARSRRTVNPKLVAGLSQAEFSTVVESDAALVVDRTMSWDPVNAYGAHAESAVLAPQPTWYLAEGSTVGGFNLFYLLQNPNTSEAQVRVRYLLPSGPPLEKSYTVPALSRTNIWVNQEQFPGRGQALASTDVSAIIETTNGRNIIVERALYLDLPGQTFGAGHESAGVTATATQWFFAEGATGPFLDLFVLLANPGATNALVEATYLLPDGTTITRSYAVAANSRFNIWVDLEDPRLADTAVSTTIRSTNGVPIIAERAMWWPGSFGQWTEAHNSPGATATGVAWALAEGEVGGPRDVETYILIANVAAQAGTVSVTLYFEDGSSAKRTFTVSPNSRFNVDARAEFPASLNRRFGTLVASQGTTPAQIVVERAMYWNALGQTWAAGTNSLATRLR